MKFKRIYIEITNICNLKCSFCSNSKRNKKEMSIDEFEIEFGFNKIRKTLIEGLKLGIEHLKDCGCKNLYIDGSFVTKKEIPSDFDACWDEDGVDLARLISTYPTIVNFDEGRKYQKLLYGGEFFLMNTKASPYDTFINFFQKDRDGNKKGIVNIKLN